MIIVLSIIGFLLVFLSMGYTFILFKKLSKIKKSRSVQFSKLIESNGDYGMKKMKNPSSDFSSNEFLMEFKVIGKAKNKKNYVYLNIHVLNVSLIDLEDEGNKIDTCMQLLYGKQWMYNDDDIYWFTDNQARRRDDILTDLLKEETK